MTVLDSIERLEQSKEFSSWKKTHEKAYLAHCFRMLDAPNKGIWQIGYYNPQSNLITVFVVDKDITRTPDAEVFKEQKKLVKPLEKKDVKVDEDEALLKAKEVFNEHYKTSTVFKEFMILQNLDEFGQVWNITFVTDQFKTVNVKIDAKSGDCTSHKIISLIEKE